MISYPEFTVISAKMRSLLIENNYTLQPFILLLYREKFYFDTFRVPRSNRKLLFPVTLTPHLATWGKAELFSELKSALCGMEWLKMSIIW